MTATSDQDRGGIEYPYVCEACGQGFLTASAHNAHQRVHSEGDLIVPSTTGDRLEDQ